MTSRSGLLLHTVTIFDHRVVLWRRFRRHLFRDLVEYCAIVRANLLWLRNTLRVVNGRLLDRHLNILLLARALSEHRILHLGLFLDFNHLLRLDNAAILSDDALHLIYRLFLNWGRWSLFLLHLLRDRSLDFHRLLQLLICALFVLLICLWLTLLLLIFVWSVIYYRLDFWPDNWCSDRRDTARAARPHTHGSCLHATWHSTRSRRSSTSHSLARRRHSWPSLRSNATWSTRRTTRACLQKLITAERLRR